MTNTTKPALSAAPVAQEPVAYLRDLQPYAEDEALAVCNKIDPGAFAVYRAPPATSAGVGENELRKLRYENRELRERVASQFTQEQYHQAKAASFEEGKLAVSAGLGADEIARAIEALKPFAEFAHSWRDIPGVVKTNPDVELWQKPGAIERSGLNVGHLRAAVDALALLSRGAGSDQKRPHEA